jgi:hypothetical protein
MSPFLTVVKMIDSHCNLLSLCAMLQQEDRYYTISDFFRDLPIHDHNGQLSVDPNARRQIAQWIVKIMEACNYKKEFADITMSILDRFVDTTDGHHVLVDRGLYQLAALSALYVSVKIHCPQALSPDLVAQLSQGSFSRSDIESMERRILFALQWTVNPPTVMSFVRSYLDVIPVDRLDDETRKLILDLASLQADMAVLDSRFIPVKASRVALGSLMNAVESIFVDNAKFCKSIVELVAFSTDIDPYDLQDIRCNLYEAITDETSMESSAAQRNAFQRPVNKTMRRASFIESPRSVIEHDEPMEH